MNGSSASWRNTTHDWASSVDPEHLALIRRDPAGLAPGGVRQLVLEVLAYAADEAEYRGAGRCTVTLHPDGSVSVADDGRGTDTRFDEHGRPVRKPVMATKDLRFFDHPDAESLPTGIPAGACPSSRRSASGSSTPTAVRAEPGANATSTVCRRPV
ncbi:hypothetical protein ACWGCI_18510 [Streptomyces sp. NPDC054949]